MLYKLHQLFFKISLSLKLTGNGCSALEMCIKQKLIKLIEIKRKPKKKKNKLNCNHLYMAIIAYVVCIKCGCACSRISLFFFDGEGCK